MRSGVGILLLLAGCATAPQVGSEPAASPDPIPGPGPVEEPVEPAVSPDPIPEPEPEPVEVEEPEPELEPEVKTQPARPNPARVRESIRAIFDQELGRQPGDDELRTSEQAWFDFWDAGRDADAVWREWFRDRYEAELDRRGRQESSRQSREMLREGSGTAGCMSGGVGYDGEDC